MDISDATRRNWQRLNVDAEHKLQRRANKSRSGKRIMPLEYIKSPECIRFAETLQKQIIENPPSCGDVIFSLARKILKKQNLLHRRSVKKILAEFRDSGHREIPLPPLPESDADLLGFVYQCLLTEGEKNIAGAYYTPRPVVMDMLAGLDLSQNRSFFDPCCGSGAFLLAVPAEHPDQLWGCDQDPIAVFITKINLLCKFREYDFDPQIFCCDYLTPPHPLSGLSFDRIATNPPWGAGKNRSGDRKGDSFHLFFQQAAAQLKKDGKMIFLLPESVLQVKKHAALRKFILQKKLEKIVLYPHRFSGVMTRCAAIGICNAPPEKTFELHQNGTVTTQKQEHFNTHPDHIFSFLSDVDREILTHVQRQKNVFLSSGCFALGIVTGDNKRFVSGICEKGMEPVFTGKEVQRYVLKSPAKFLHHTPQKFQQTAPEKYYRSPEKLIYKFISGNLIFAYDNTGSLVLNSANILIPDIPGMSIKTVLAFLNSDFFRYYYPLISGGVKVLRSSLMQLPFPEIASETATQIEYMVDQILGGNDCQDALQQIIYDCYHLSNDQISTIKKRLAVPE